MFGTKILITVYGKKEKYCLIIMHPSGTLSLKTNTKLALCKEWVWSLRNGLFEGSFSCYCASDFQCKTFQASTGLYKYFQTVIVTLVFKEAYLWLESTIRLLKLP